VTTRLLPAFESRCRAWYGTGHAPGSELRLWLYAQLSALYGVDALLRHRALLRDALEHAEARAKRESENRRNGNVHPATQ
jgi:hypothetical protein